MGPRTPEHDRQKSQKCGHEGVPDKREFAAFIHPRLYLLESAFSQEEWRQLSLYFGIKKDSFVLSLVRGNKNDSRNLVC